MAIHYGRVGMWQIALAMLLSVIVEGSWATLALHSAQSAAQGAHEKLLDSSAGNDWAAFGRTYGEQHYSPLDKINEGNVASLGLAWWADLSRGHSTTGPLAVDGTLYFATRHAVIQAVDAVSGRTLWVHDSGAAAKAGHRLRQAYGTRGIAWWNGKIYAGTTDGRLIALDAKTGKEVWSVLTVPGGPDDVRFISGAPRAFNGKVIIGHGGADAGPTRGYVTAYDAETGEQLWRFYTVPGNPADGFENSAMEMAAKTWSGKWWVFGGGGTVWNAITYDADTDAIFLGTGNGYPWNHRIRSEGKGDNLFLSSIVALDAQTGEYKWHYQTNPGETWDYNAAMDMQLAELMIDGKRRKVLMTAPKNGFFYVIDRVSGELISAEPFAKQNWASYIDLATGRPVENPDARYADGKTFLMWPGTVGAHNWLPMAFSPKTNLVYIPTLDMANSYSDDGVDLDGWTPPGNNLADGGIIVDGMPEQAGPENGTSYLQAWDPVEQKMIWKVTTPGVTGGGVAATGGGLVFQGQIDGKFNAYSAATGKLLWTYQVGAPVIGPPITYMADGRQYVTVISGMGTSFGIFGDLLPFDIEYRSQKRRVLTFALHGTATLPAVERTVIRPVNDRDYQPNSESAARGEALYEQMCGGCHGIGTVAGGTAPDLRASPMTVDAAAFKLVVNEGLLTANGMPQFEELGDQELSDIRQYIRTKAQRMGK